MAILRRKHWLILAAVSLAGLMAWLIPVVQEARERARRMTDL